MLKCLHYNYNNNETCIDSYEKCAKEVTCPDPGSHCFLLWQVEANISKALGAGCHSIANRENSTDNCSDECIGQVKGPRYYCCCSTNLCNKYYKLSSRPSQEFNTTKIIPQEIHEPQLNIFWSVVPILLTISLIFAYVYKSRKKIPNKLFGGGNSSSDNIRRNIQGCNLTASELNELMPFSNSNGNEHFLSNNNNKNNNKGARSNRIDLSSVELLEVIGTGRFGTVHRAKLRQINNNDNQNDQDSSEIEIAVKIIPTNEHQSWFNEQIIYNSPKIKHRNILNFLYSDQHLPTESYWLLVDYASKGSLYSYLKENLVTWKEFLYISLGIVHGLSHLHEADIAHRDFKSKNVLLKHDLTPCITDFGVAALLHTAAGAQLDYRRKYLQVGTPRYMAPEVLECSVTFTKASFTKIDVYALSLVLWELISRCYPLPRTIESVNPQQQQQPFKLPFEDIAGPHPDINTMLQIVVVDKIRPALRDDWRLYPANDFCRAIEDGWEYDHDARISASCFVERVEGLPQSF